MPPEDEDDYRVGYGKPPRHTRFSKGQCGNPRGRPSGSKNLRTLLAEALSQTVTVVENGGRKKVTKRAAMIAQLVNKSAKADLRAIKILLDLDREIETRAAAGPGAAGATPADLDHRDRDIIERFLKKQGKNPDEL
jgi:Family of unknown function (DUF5681)